MDKNNPKTKKTVDQPVAASTDSTQAPPKAEQVVTTQIDVFQLDGGLTLALPPADELDSPWSDQDDEDHQRCVLCIKKGKMAFIEVGLALGEVKQKRLYRKTHPTFESFCKEHVGFKRQYAYRLIEGADTTARLVSRGDSPAPQSEAQARQLAGLSEDEQVCVMNSAAAAAGGTPTTKTIKEAATKKKQRAKMNVVEEADSPEDTTGTEEDSSVAKAPARRKQVEAISIRSTLDLVANAITLLKRDDENVDVEKLLELLEDIELGLQEFQQVVEEKKTVETKENN